MRETDIMGRWELVSFARWRDGREADHPLGPKPSGLIHYTTDHGMSSFLYKDPSLTWDVPMLAAYGGTWKLIGNDVHHDVQFNTDTERMGTVLVRHARFDGPLLVLETPVKNGVSIRITWRRPKPA